MNSPRRKSQTQPRNQSFQWALLGLLAVAAGFIAVMQFSGGSPAAAAANEVNTSGVHPSQTPAAAMPAAATTDLNVTWPVKMHRDIFTWDHAVVQVKAQVVAGPDPHAIEREARESIRLQGIMLDGLPRIQANGRIILLGGEIRGFTLKQIHHREIILHKQGINVTLPL